MCTVVNLFLLVSGPAHGRTAVVYIACPGLAWDRQTVVDCGRIGPLVILKFRVESGRVSRILAVTILGCCLISLCFITPRICDSYISIFRLSQYIIPDPSTYLFQWGQSLTTGCMAALVLCWVWASVPFGVGVVVGQNIRWR
jgi:hypothetical protein